MKSFSGVVQADAFAGYDALYADGTILEAACWAHARRKFFELRKAPASPIAAEALKRIGALYAIEAEVHGRLPDERRSVRMARAGPLLDDFKVWLTETLARLSKKSALADAIGCAQALAGADPLCR